jgi:hypothetical protein
MTVETVMQKVQSNIRCVPTISILRSASRVNFFSLCNNVVSDNLNYRHSRVADVYSLNLLHLGTPKAEP